jgi:hypothetical protein
MQFSRLDFFIIKKNKNKNIHLLMQLSSELYMFIHDTTAAFIVGGVREERK